ncbi:MAG: tripartite tricarboxylate transporter substrate binding protein, partial [Burkholderiales bacterium]|nr:tripartite tricarboxylate transporter substrate binding protein [Burkholderiales bacterium]
MKRTARAAVGLAAALLAAPLAAQDYPAKPVRVIVPNAPGGLADIAARLVAGKLSENLGRQFLVDNRVGAGGIIGTAAAARAVPDGYTLLVVFDSHATNPHLFNKLEYDTLADFSPVSLLVKGPMLLVVQPKVPAGSVQEFVQLAKAKPGAVNFLTVGPGSPARLLTELFKSTAGIDVTMVSYKGAGPAMTDLIAGVVDAMFATIPTVSAQVRAKKLRALAVTSDSRFQFLPEVPAMAELFPG